MATTTRETIDMLENLLNSQIMMGQVMDSILVILDAPPAPMEELVGEVLQPMADAVRQAGARLGLDFQVQELEQGEQPIPEPVPEWDQMDEQQRATEVKRIKATRFIAKKEREQQALIISMPQLPASEDVTDMPPALSSDMADLMGSMMDMMEASEPTSKLGADESDLMDE